MTGEEWALAASVFFSGLAAGFLGALCTIIRPMQAAMDGRSFRNFMEAFLRVVRGARMKPGCNGHANTDGDRAVVGQKAQSDRGQCRQICN